MKHILFLYFLYTTIVAIGQDTISASRPGQCISSSALKQGTLQLQTGIQFDDFGNSTLEVPTTLLRYGLTKNIEIRVYDQFTKLFTPEELTLNSPQASLLINVTKGNKKIPELAVQPYIDMSNSLSTGMILSGSNSLNDVWGYSFNLAENYNNQTWVAYYAFAVNYTYKKTTFFVETFGDMLPGATQFDAGFGWLMNPNIQLDLYGGTNAHFDGYFISGGICAILKHGKS